MIQVIEDGAFKYCKILENIELNEELTFLGEDVFNNTLWLENIKPDNYGCKYYKNILLCCNGQSPYVEIKSGTRIIAGGAFSLLSTLEKISLPESLKFIGKFAFEECSGLHEVMLPPDVEEIGEFAFKGCQNLNHINIPPKVEKIQKYTFAYCSNLEEVILENKLVEIDETAFKDCDKLR